jgi:hypothetical protein
VAKDYRRAIRRATSGRGKDYRRAILETTLPDLGREFQEVADSVSRSVTRAAQPPRVFGRPITVARQPRVVPQLDPTRLTTRVMDPGGTKARKEARDFARSVGAHTPEDLAFVLTLPDAKVAQLISEHARRVQAARAYRPGSRLTGLARPESAPPFLPGTPGALRAADRAAINRARDEVARIARESVTRARVGSQLTDRPVSASEIMRHELEQLGKPKVSPLLVGIGRLANAPFSAVGNLIAAHPLEATKNVVTLGQAGRQTTVGTELQRRGLIPQGRSYQEAADFVTYFLAPEFSTLSAARGLSAARAASRAATLPRVARTAAGFASDAATTAAYLPGRALRAGARPASLLREMRSGPDIVPNPSARVVRISGGRGRRPVSASREPRPVVRRSITEMPYAPGRQATRAVEQLRAAEVARAEALRPRTTLTQAAKASAAVERARVALRSAEAESMARVRARRAPALPVRPTATPRQKALYRSMFSPTLPRSGFGARYRPRAPRISDVRSLPYPATSKLPAARVTLSGAKANLETLIANKPLPAGRLLKIGSDINRARAQLRKVESRIYGQATQRMREARRFRGAKPTARQKAIFRETFTGSSARELIEANIAVSEAEQAARASSPVGIKVYLPFSQQRVGIEIPLLPASARKALPPQVREFADTMRRYLVTQYGPNKVAGDAARAADDWVRASNGAALEFVLRESRKLSKSERQQAVRVIEGTLKPGEKVAPHVRRYAERMSRFVEDLTDQFLQAGGNLRRIEEGYVFHLLSPEDWAKLGKDPSLQRRRLVFARDPSFAKQRARPDMTIEDLKALGYNPVDDLAEIVYARAAAHNRAVADMELVRSLQARKWNTDDLVPLEARFADREVLVPRDVAETLLNVEEARRFMFGGRHLARTSRTVKRFNAFTKQMMLLTTGYDVRNQIGDMILQLQAGHNPISSLARGVRTMRRSAKAGRGGYSYAEVANLAESLGVARKGMLGREVKAHLPDEPRGKVGVRGRPAGPAARAMGTGQAIRMARENVNRYGLFANLLPREGPVLAARRVNQALYNYGDVGRAVQVARTYPIVPFGTWLAKNIPAQVRHALERPRNPLMLQAGMNLLAEQAGGGTGIELPDYVRRGMPIQIPGFGWISGSFLPQADILRIMPGGEGGGQEWARDWFANLHPYLQFAVAAATGADPRTGDKLRSRVRAGGAERLGQMFPFLGPLAFGDPREVVRAYDKEGKPVAVPATTGLGRFLSRFLNPAAVTYGQFATPGPTGSVAEQALAVFGGMRRYRFNDPAQIRAAIGARIARYLDLEEEAKRHAQDYALAGRKTLPPELREMDRLMQEIQALNAMLERTGATR